MSKADDILFFDVILSVMLFAYGAGTNSISLDPFSSLPAPKFLQIIPLNFCQLTDLSCNTANIVIATGWIGVAIFNLGGVIGYVVLNVVYFLETVLALTFSPTLSASGIPFLGFIFSGLQLYIIWEVIRTLRGSSTGV